MEKMVRNDAQNTREYVLKLEDIHKNFPGTKALDGASLNVYKGKVMGLLGENGAGKSTLMKVLNGIYQKDKGVIYFEGQVVKFNHIRQAQKAGIAMVHQEPHILPDLTIAENVLLGQELMQHRFKINWKAMYKKVDDLLQSLHMKQKAKSLAQGVSIGDQKLLEIAKALSIDAKVIIMDEPTDALTEKEVLRLFEIIRKLCFQGKSIIYISHRMEEIFDICDDITIMRDGQSIIESPISILNYEQIIEKMVGRKLEQITYKGQSILKSKQKVFCAQNISNNQIKPISFEIYQGEVLGFYGLIGAGRTQLARSIYGCYPIVEGELILEGKLIKVKSPYEAIVHGIIYISEDRKIDGLIIGASVRENMSLSTLKSLSNRFGHIDCKKEKEEVNRYIEKFKIKTSSQTQLVQNLSGGNQQKISIAKGLMCHPKLLILDEPTRGIDVAAKREIYRLIHEFKQRGLAILLISSEMPEVIGLSDRLMVMSDRQIKGELELGAITQEAIMKLALG
ncbi:sugar ABC transporter ATP-binding protein [Fastidiosibacter lacustris]|uniref:sugar ABC transporter ATP-binding protein n=1 Tax=Fastidiosibacter lacustris TaxID=2056695 RepID=UPI001EFCBB6B|nr:ATP-binding cassette domain-containing protein [Fastidiosibacter lacustris]